MSTISGNALKYRIMAVPESRVSHLNVKFIIAEFNAWGAYS